jgi:hypothetical protein
MVEADRSKYLRVALVVVGLLFIVGIYTLGVFLLFASRDPRAHLSLIWFTVWSSVVHAAIMAAQSLANPEHRAHLWGDVAALFVIAGVLALLTPRHAETKPALKVGA